MSGKQPTLTTTDHTKRDDAPSEEEVVAGLKGSLGRMLEALYAARKTAPTPEDAAEVARMIELAERLANDTLSAFGAPDSPRQLQAPE